MVIKEAKFHGSFNPPLVGVLDPTAGHKLYQGKT
jgi:hypothetical protein